MTVEIQPGCEPFSHHAGPSGVLVLHGFTGNPASMRPLAELLAKAGYSVELPRLPGHGTSVEEMLTTTWADWSLAAEEAFDSLDKHCDRVAVVGLSMGGGLAAHVAEVRTTVVGCVFINPLVKPPENMLLEGADGVARERCRDDRVDRFRYQEGRRRRGVLRLDATRSRPESFRRRSRRQ